MEREREVGEGERLKVLAHTTEDGGWNPKSAGLGGHLQSQGKADAVAGVHVPQESSWGPTHGPCAAVLRSGSASGDLPLLLMPSAGQGGPPTLGGHLLYSVY